MKSFIVVCLFALAAVVYARPDEPQYTNRYDTINLDEILANRRLLVPYIKCCLDQGKCSPEGKELKMHIEEALSNNCAKCTDAQKDGTRRVIRHLIEKEKEFWAQLKAKYDPEGKYTKSYERELSSLTA